jgi:Arc/MetJ family transcription regulator
MEVLMATNLAIDDELLERALHLGGMPSKRATVNEALREFIARRKRRAALDAIGAIDFVDDFDPKAARAKR